MYQAGELPKTLRVSKIHYEPSETVCKAHLASIFPPSMENGDGTRHQDIEEGCLKAQEELDCLDLSELEPEAKAPLRARRKKCPC